ncbi:MAG: transcriptional coactivator/pterin dehydratase [Myxococcaceae bacterium]|nr:transcriptional coactivator/pterin dehydratase [Myxococcaceae bacterium]
MPIAKLTEEEITERLKQCPSWSVVHEKLHHEFSFSNFVRAFGFMTEVAMLAERRDHHPEWSNVYGRVVIDLTTHDCDGISARDFELARAIDELSTP